MCKSEGNFVKLVLSLHLYVDSRNELRSSGLYSKHLYPLSHFASPNHSGRKVLGESGGLVMYQVWEHCSGAGTFRKEWVNSGNRDVVVHSDKFWPQVSP